ncbi:hypothetical protein ACTXHA_16080 [Burkholderia cenocepacia]
MSDESNFDVGLPGLPGVIEKLIASEKALAEAKKRNGTANESHPLYHSAPLHHRIQKRYTIILHNRTPFGMRLAFWDSDAKISLLNPQGTLNRPGHYRKYVLGNENIKGDGCPTFRGTLAWKFETATQGNGDHMKMNGSMVFGLSWAIAGNQEDVWREWSDEKDSGPYWSKFSSRSELSHDDDDFTVANWWVEFKK